MLRFVTNICLFSVETKFQKNFFHHRGRDLGIGQHWKSRKRQRYRLGWNNITLPTLDTHAYLPSLLCFVLLPFPYKD